MLNMELRPKRIPKDRRNVHLFVVNGSPKWSNLKKNLKCIFYFWTLSVFTGLTSRWICGWAGGWRITLVSESVTRKLGNQEPTQLALLPRKSPCATCLVLSTVACNEEEKDVPQLVWCCNPWYWGVEGVVQYQNLWYGMEQGTFYMCVFGGAKSILSSVS